MPFYPPRPFAGAGGYDGGMATKTKRPWYATALFWTLVILLVVTLSDFLVVLQHALLSSP
jgi:hypothetical protein